MARAIGFAAAGATLDVLQASGSAAVLFNRWGEVFQMNRSAEDMLKGDVHVANRRLVAGDPKSTAAFDRALHELVWRRADTALSPPVVLRRQEQYPLIAYLVKPSAIAANLLADCKAIAVFIDVGSKARVPETVLRTAFNLTEAEARLAAGLAAGHALEDIARTLGLTKETVRTQIKGLFAKTHTHRQGELISLLGPFAARAK